MCSAFTYPYVILHPLKLLAYHLEAKVQVRLTSRFHLGLRLRKALKTSCSTGQKFPSLT